MKTGIIFWTIIFSSLAGWADKIRVGSSPVLSSAGIYLAEHLGYFKNEGLDVEISDFATSGASMTLLLSKGDLDVGAGNLTSGLFNAILKGEKFKLVADKGHVEKGKEYMKLLVRQDLIESGRFKTMKDMRGFKIGVTALDGVSQQIVIDRFLKKNGLKESDIEYVKMSYAEMNVALKTKNIDAAIQLEPFLTKALEGIPVKAVASTADVHPNQQSAALFYSPQFILKKNEAEKFMKAYLLGVRAYNEAITGKNPEATAALKKIFKIDDTVWNKMAPVGLHNDGRLNVSDLMADIRWYKEKSYVKGNLTAKDLIDDSFARKVSKTLVP